VALFVLATVQIDAADDQTASPAAPPAKSNGRGPGWIGLLGSGLLTLQDIETVPRGRFVFALTVDNRDRDPLGLDLLDGAVAWSVGLRARMETYGRVVTSRVVTVPGSRPPLPPPPLDLIVPPAAVAPRRPYYPLFSLTPYVNDRGKARFSSWVPGDAILGVKLRLAEPRGGRPGLAVAGEVTVPMPGGLADLQAGAGTGTVDLGARAVGEWRLRGTSLVASALFVRTGGARYGDRLVTLLPPAGTEGHSRARVAELPLELPHRLELGLGARRPLRSWLAAVVEVTAAMEVGHRSQALDRITPVDLLAGAQVQRGRLRCTAALRYHGNALRSGEVRPSPLAGAVDLTGVPTPALEAYLGEAGADSALSWLRSRSQRVLLAPPPGASLPPGARLVPPEYEISSEHQVGFLFTFGWAF
jgi:hypothetical protein